MTSEYMHELPIPHVSVVHAFMSSQSIWVLQQPAMPVFWQVPLEEHVSAVHTSLSSQSVAWFAIVQGVQPMIGVLTHLPPVHASVVHAMPSSHTEGFPPEQAMQPGTVA
jgi:hypothetical protein